MRECDYGIGLLAGWVGGVLGMGEEGGGRKRGLGSQDIAYFIREGRDMGFRGISKRDWDLLCLCLCLCLY